MPAPCCVDSCSFAVLGESAVHHSDHNTGHHLLKAGQDLFGLMISEGSVHGQQAPLLRDRGEAEHPGRRSWWRKAAGSWHLGSRVGWERGQDKKHLPGHTQRPTFFSHAPPLRVSTTSQLSMQLSVDRATAGVRVLVIQSAPRSPSSVYSFMGTRSSTREPLGRPSRPSHSKSGLKSAIVLQLCSPLLGLPWLLWVS